MTLALSMNENLNRLMSGGITILDFIATWSRPCRAQRRIISAFERKARGSATVKQLNIDEYRDLALRLGIQSIPTIIFFKDGKEASRLIGLQPLEALTDVLQSLTN